MDRDRDDMDCDEGSRKGIVTSIADDGKEFLTWLVPGEDDGDNVTDESADLIRVSRRSYLASAGVVTASAIGFDEFGGEDTAGFTQVMPVSGYGYGGNQVMEQEDASVTLTVTETEPNDTQSEAMSITLGETVEADLTQTDVDWYAVDVETGTELLVELDREPTSGVVAAILYDVEGEFLNIRYVNTGEPTGFTATTEQSGTHFVQVVDTQDGDGNYTLTVEDTEATATPTPTDTPSGTTTPTSTPSPTDTPTPIDTVTPTPTDTPAPTPTDTPTPTPTEDDYGEQGYGEYGYGGVSA